MLLRIRLRTRQVTRCNGVHDDLRMRARGDDQPRRPMRAAPSMPKFSGLGVDGLDSVGPSLLTSVGYAICVRRGGMSNRVKSV